MATSQSHWEAGQPLPSLHWEVMGPAQQGHGQAGGGEGGRPGLTSSASLSSFSSVSSPFSCWSLALFLKASFSGLPGSEG